MTTSEALVRLAIALPLGLVFGGFLTVAIHRVPAGESLVKPPSRCPSCGSPLRNAYKIPVVSWVALGGRCHACRARISAVYPLTELACGALFVAVALVYEDPWQAVLLAPFSGLLVALSVIDIRHHRIPNVLVGPAVLVSAGFIVVADRPSGSDMRASISARSVVPSISWSGSRASGLHDVRVRKAFLDD